MNSLAKYEDIGNKLHLVEYQCYRDRNSETELHLCVDCNISLICNKKPGVNNKNKVLEYCKYYF